MHLCPIHRSASSGCKARFNLKKNTWQFEQSHRVTLSEAKGPSRSAARCFAALSMTELDLSVDGELSSSFEPCLNKINIHINFINVGIDFVNHPCYIFHSSRWYSPCISLWGENKHRKLMGLHPFRGKSNAGDHKGPPHHSPPPSPLRMHSPARTKTQIDRGEVNMERTNQVDGSCPVCGYGMVISRLSCSNCGS